MAKKRKPDTRPRCIVPRADGSPCTLAAARGELWCNVHGNWIKYSPAGREFIEWCMRAEVPPGAAKEGAK